MAIVATKLSKDLLIGYDYGIVDGKQKIKTRTYGVIQNATDEKVYTLATAISGLCDKELVNVNVKDINGLAQE